MRAPETTGSVSTDKMYGRLCEQAASNYGLPHSGGLLEVQLCDAPLPATHCKIARVKGNWNHADPSSALCLFFHTPRLLHLGDVFAVPLPRDPLVPPLSSTRGHTKEIKEPEQYLQRPWGLGGQKANLQPGLAYFQVTDVVGATSSWSVVCDDQPAGFLVSQKTTTLTQVGWRNSYVPNPKEVGPFVRKVLLEELSSQQNNGDYSYLWDLCPEQVEPLLTGDNEAAYGQLKDIFLLVKEWPKPAREKGRSAMCNKPILIGGRQGSGRSRLVHSVGNELGFHTVEFELQTMLGNPGGLSVAVALQEAWHYAQSLAPSILFLRGLDPSSIASDGGGGSKDDPAQHIAMALKSLQLGIQQSAETCLNCQQTVIVASSDNLDELPMSLRAEFLHEIKVRLPGEKSCLLILEHEMEDVALHPDVDFKTVVRQMAGKTPREIRAFLAYVVANAQLAHHTQQLLEDVGFGHCHESKETIMAPELCIAMKDFADAEKKMCVASSLKVGVAKIPEVKWEDVGGLGHIRKEILDIVELPIKCPHLFASGLKRRSGILLYGPPGTGKTLIAKAVATECQMTFLSVKGPELLDMYIGESEKNVRAVFAQARAAAPAVLFFDELDSLAPQRGRGSDSGGVMDRVVAQILAEIDGITTGCGDSGDESIGSNLVIVMGATNRPDLLDPSLLRPGRFDRLLYLGTSQERTTQLKVLQAVTRKFSMEEGFVLEDVLAILPPQFTGADLSAVASTAFSIALQQKVKDIEEKVRLINADRESDAHTTARALLQSMDEKELVTKISLLHFQQAAKLVDPSVSAEELEHYERLKLQFSGKS